MEANEILNKPEVGGTDLCRRCAHQQWEHNMDILVDGKIVRSRNQSRLDDICLHNGSLLCCHANCRKFE